MSRLRPLFSRAVNSAIAPLCAGLLLTSALWFIPSAANPAWAEVPRFTPPVAADVIDPFRPPATPYGPGNRGWEYATEPGAEVRAAGVGTVRFAGPVGGSYAVTVAHGGGLRTTYSYLATIAVTAGQVVERGAVVGTTVDRLHFGVLLRDRYLDPAVLFREGALRQRARLLPRA